MPKFYVYRTNLMEVTEVVEIEADNQADALSSVIDGEGEYIGLTVGDISVMSNETTDVLPAARAHIPANFYPASTRT